MRGGKRVEGCGKIVETQNGFNISVEICWWNVKNLLKEKGGDSDVFPPDLLRS